MTIETTQLHGFISQLASMEAVLETMADNRDVGDGSIWWMIDNALGTIGMARSELGYLVEAIKDE